jgi:phage-related protein
VNTISGAVVGAWNAIAKFWNNVVTAFNGIKDAISNSIRTAIDSIANFIGSAVNAGKNLIDGIAKGISNAKDAVVNKIKEICSGALDAVKNFFGIKSPSRVMASMGDYMMQGMQNGIERAGGAVVDAATTIADKISTGMSNSLQNVSDGAQSVVGVYSGMYGQLNAMNAVQAGTIDGTVSAINGAAAATATTGGAIAQPPINITLEQSGIVARSRSEFRDIIADGIEAVNEDLRARGYGEIGNGNVKGMSTI